MSRIQTRGYCGWPVGAQSRRRQFCIVLTLLLIANASPSIANKSVANIPIDNVHLFLEIYVNGKPKNLIVDFVQDSDGRFRTLTSELNAIGIDPGQKTGDGSWVYIDSIAGVDFDYDAKLQTMHFSLQPDQNTISNYNLRGSIDAVPLLKPSTGVMLNYVLTGQVSSETSSFDPRFNGASALVDARMFSSLGSFSQSLLLSARGEGNRFEIRRLDSYWTKSDPDRQLTYTAGDLITGGLNWTRPIRLGGLSLRRNFAIRPDLVTRPLPGFAGTALVPSTVDVFLGDLRLSSVDVEAGRYSLRNIDVPNQSGDLRFTVTDSSGTVREETLSFTASQALLRKGLVDFSIDTGFARTGYGTQGDSYGSDAVGVGSLRYGLNDSLTLEAHGEVGAGLTNGGIGLTASLAKFGSLNVAVAGSNYSNLSGALVSVGYTFSQDRYSIQAESRRTFSEYRDLADVTANNLFAPDALARITASDRLHVSSRFLDTKASVGLGYTHIERKDDDHSHLLNASLGYQFNPQARFSLDGFTEIGGKRRSSIHAGLHIMLGDDKYLSSSSGYEDGGYGVSTTFSKAARQERDSWSYGANLRKTNRNLEMDARASHFGEKMRSTGIVSGSGDSIGLYGSVEGSAAFIDGDIRFLQRIDDSFVVVDAGVPGVRVYRENQLIGRTDKTGKLFVPGVRSYERNKISIEPADLPLDSSISQTSKQIALPEKSGAVIRFSEQAKGSKSGLVAFVDKDGTFLPVGSTGRNLATSEDFVVGYDGEAYIKDMKSDNSVEIYLGMTTCRAEFRLSVADPVVCRAN